MLSNMLMTSKITLDPFNLSMWTPKICHVHFPLRRHLGPKNASFTPSSQTVQRAEDQKHQKTVSDQAGHLLSLMWLGLRHPRFVV